MNKIAIKNDTIIENINNILNIIFLCIIVDLSNKSHNLEIE